MISPSQKTLEVFREDLWKDQRRLEKASVGGKTCLIKYYVSEDEAKHEKAVLRRLSSDLQTACVPDVLDEGADFAVLPYLSGIRVFNLFVELDRLKPPIDGVAREIKSLILRRCEDNQREIQAVLTDWSKESHPTPYPQHKITTLIRLLADCFGIDIDHDRLDEETAQLADILTRGSSVPFRDATTKNMVLAAPELWLGNFKGEDERSTAIYESLCNSSRPGWLDAPIYDFDFASCINTTTPEDDVVSLRFHERSWAGMPESADDLVWHGEPDAERAAITFFVRYYRFGGRKAAYRLLHPSGHRIRFRHDNDVFYFERAPSVMKHLWPDAQDAFPELLEFTSIVSKCLQVPVSSYDFFRAKYGKTLQQRTYYVDMFPE